MAGSKEPVRLRERLMKSGLTSLYLDIYVNGRRSYEYLRLYLIPERTRADKEKNRQTVRLAEAVRAKRLLEVQSGRFGLETEGSGEGVDFLAYYRALCERRRGGGKDGSLGNWQNWKGALKYLEDYCAPGLTFKEITPEWVRGFKEYLNTAKNKYTAVGVKERRPLAQNSKVAYFNKIRACINAAVEEGIITRNPLRGIEGFKTEEKERVYLTLEEVRRMAAGECPYPVLRRAFLFSCLTGLRKSDIMKMRWSEVRREGDFTRIVFRQKKTGGQEYLDISKEAVEYLGERGEEDELVFKGFSYTSYTSVALRAWALNCGITKPLTFHSGRHTFATLMLTLGADIYTVSKLLGHREIATTQIYAKVTDARKRAAVDLIPGIKGAE